MTDPGKPTADSRRQAAKSAQNAPSRDHEASNVKDFGQVKYDPARDVKNPDEQQQLETERDYGRD